MVTRSVLSAQVEDRLLPVDSGGRPRAGARIIETRVTRQLGTSQAPVRSELEAMAARQATRVIDEATLAPDARPRERHAAKARRGDAHTQALQNPEFLRCVIDASGRTAKRLGAMLEPFASLAERHVAIDALEAGDAERSADALRAHAREAEEQVPRTRRDRVDKAT